MDPECRHMGCCGSLGVAAPTLDDVARAGETGGAEEVDATGAGGIGEGGRVAGAE